jgi:hypothetical protein
MMETRSPTIRIAILASVLVASYFLVFDAGEYLRSWSPAVYGRFWPARNWMVVHMGTGALALTVGAFQFGLAFLRRTSALHRWVGRVYASAVLVSCVASLAVLRNGSVVGATWVALLVLLSTAALVSTAFGWIEARRRRWQHHAAWMLRSYMAMMVFAWFRLAMETPLLQDMPGRARATTILALTMLITLLCTEVALYSLRAKYRRCIASPAQAAQALPARPSFKSSV